MMAEIRGPDSHNRFTAVILNSSKRDWKRIFADDLDEIRQRLRQNEIVEQKDPDHRVTHLDRKQ